MKIVKDFWSSIKGVFGNERGSTVTFIAAAAI